MCIGFTWAKRLMFINNLARIDVETLHASEASGRVKRNLPDGIRCILSAKTQFVKPSYIFTTIVVWQGDGVSNENHLDQHGQLPRNCYTLITLKAARSRQ